MGCWEYNNRYNLLDQNGAIVLSAKEQSHCMQRAFFNNIRAFSMPLVNPEVSIIDVNIYIYKRDKYYLERSYILRKAITLL